MKLRGGVWVSDTADAEVLAAAVNAGALDARVRGNDGLNQVVNEGLAASELLAHRQEPLAVQSSEGK